MHKTTAVPDYKRYSPNAGSMLTHLLRRWPSIEPTLGERLVFVGVTAFSDTSDKYVTWKQHINNQIKIYTALLESNCRISIWVQFFSIFVIYFKGRKCIDLIFLCEKPALLSVLFDR